MENQKRDVYMVDTIGRCECINYSDKFDMDQLITKEIDELYIRLTNIRNARKELEEFGANPNELSKRYESQKIKIKKFITKSKKYT